MAGAIRRGLEQMGQNIQQSRQASKKQEENQRQADLFSRLGETLGRDLAPKRRDELNPLFQSIGQAVAAGDIDAAGGMSTLQSIIEGQREARLAQDESKLKGFQIEKAQQDIAEGEFERQQRELKDVTQTRDFKSKMALEKAKATASSKQKLLEGGINIENIDFDNPNDVAQAFQDLTLNEVEKDILKDEIKGSSRLFKGLKRFATAVDAFKRAMPADVLPAVQRVRGPLLSFGAKTGIVPNEELLALQNQIKSDAINFVKALGESGNLAQQEQQNAIDAISSADKTDEERNASVRIALEKGMSGYSTDALSVLLKDPSIVDMLVSFEVPIKNLKYMPERVKRQFAIATIRQKEALNG